MKKYLLLSVMLMTVLALFCGCDASEPTAEDINSAFTKTVHDFEGYRVDNLDEDEGNNFVVYQKGVEEIFMSDSVNVLLEADEENRVYRFANADESLLSMEKGDVFFGNAPDGLSAVAVKVESVETDGGSVTVYGGELQLGDLFEYVDIDMDVGAEHIVVGELADGVTMEYAEADAADDIAAELLADADRDAQVKLLAEAHIPLSLRFSVGLSGGLGDASLPGSTVDVRGKLALNGRCNYTLKSVDAAFHFMDDEALFFAGAAVNSATSWSVKLTGSGTLYLTQPVAPIRVPIPAFPLLNVMGDLALTVTASGSISGGISSSQDQSNGIAAGATVEDGIFIEKIDEKSDPVSTINVEELSGTFCLGPAVELGIGTWGVAKITGSVFGGVEFKGSYDPFELTDPGECIHDCTVCIDGSTDFLVRVQANAGIKLKNLKNASLTLTLPEIRSDFLDFYVSFGREGLGEPEFGWGKCPHKRYRASISVFGEDGAAGGANVSASFPDGRTDETTADENGRAVLYLPSGTSTVRANHRGANGSVDVAVDQKPVEATIKLTDERQIFVVFRYAHIPNDWENIGWGDVDRWPFITERYRKLYPNAIFLTGAEWSAAANIENGIGTGENYSTTALTEAYGVSPGDIIVDVYSAVYDTETQYHVDKTHYMRPITTPLTLNQTVGMVMLPTAEDIENGVRPDEPFVVWFGQHDVSVVHYTNGLESYPTTHIGEIAYNEDEVYYLNCLYDEDFRLTQMGEWNFTNTSFTHWQGSMITHDFVTNSMLHSEEMADYIIPKAAMTIDALWNDEWEELEETVKSDGDIVVS